MRSALPPGDDTQGRLFQQLAEYIETRDRGGPVDEETILSADPEVQDGVREYLDAVAAVDQVAAPLRALAVGYRPVEFPQFLGDYELLEEIGCGGTAIVYRARQKGLNRVVAVKVLRRGRSGSLHDVERMRFEAEAVAQLEHAGIVPIHEVGEHDGLPYFSMKLYERGSLATCLDEYRNRPRHAAELVAGVAQAVHHAHQQGILHRDLKPSNILLDSGGRPHVADFGLAKRLEADQELTQSGELIGTPAYIAPERVGGSPWSGPATIATDVFGLGAILYTLLCGQPPFRRDSSIQTLLAVSTDDPAPPTSLNPGVDWDLQIICLKCLEKDPVRRYGSALEVADDLRRWLGGEPIAARHIGRVEWLRRWCRRHPVRATASLAAAALALTAVVGLAVGYWLVSRANSVAEAHRTSAEKQARELGRRLYASQMSLGYQHLKQGELRELQSLLDAFRDQPELQGFEWRWLNHEAHAMPREAARFTGHEHIIYGGDFSPDGRTVATCGADATIRLWDAATGELRQVLDCSGELSPLGEKYDEDCVSFSPDGTRLASVSESGAVRIWTLADGTHRQLTPAPTVETLSVEFSQDGRWLVTASVDGVVRVWDADRCECVRAFPPQVESPAKWAVFSPDGRQVASINQAGDVAVVDRETGHVQLTFQTGVKSFCLAWSYDGEWLATEGAQNAVCLWNSSTGEQVSTLPAHWGVRSLDFSRDGKRLACTGNDGCVRVWSVPDGRLQPYFSAHRETVWRVRFAPEGERLLTCSSDQTASVWDVSRSSKPQPRVQFSRPVRQVAFAPDGRTLAVLTTTGEVWFGSAAGVADRRQLPITTRADVPPVFSPDGSELALLSAGGEVLRWSCLQNRVLAQQHVPRLAGHLDGRPGAMLLAYLDDGRLAALNSRGSLWICSAGDWSEVRPGRGGPGQARLLAPLAGGRTLAVCDLDPERIEFWNVERGAPEADLHCGGKLETGVVSPDERWLACSYVDGRIGLLALRAPVSQRVLVGHRGASEGLAFSPDGRTLASAGNDGTVRLWNVATGLELFVLETRPRALYSVAFSPDGELLAVGGEPAEDGTTLAIYRAPREP